MSLLAVATLLADLAAAAPPHTADLTTSAAASPRPVECGGTTPGRRGELWNRARHPGLGRYCAALARGYTTLASAPESSLAAADEAERAFPGRASPHVLAARALAALGRYEEAWQRFERATARKARLEAPGALHALARSAAVLGRADAALSAYRALVARAALIEDPWHRQVAYVEAAVWAMARGRDGLDEAVGYLTEARRQRPPPGLADYVLGALALALDRQGRTEEAFGVASAASGPWTLAGDGESADRAKKAAALPFLPPGELQAIIAMLAAHRDAETARDNWQAFLEAQGSGPYAEHARRQLARPAGKRDR